MATKKPDALTTTFPQPVHDSLAELRAIAKRARSRMDPTLRRATEAEIQLAETLRKPWHCIGKSSRTGLPCTAPRILGASVCKVHGGALKRTKIAAANRLREITMPVIESMYQAATQTENLAAAVKAGSDLLGRSGVGALAQAKVRASKPPDNGRIVINLGFLSPDGGQSPVIVVPAKHGPDEE